MNISVFIGNRLSFKASADNTRGKKYSPGISIAIGGIALALTIMLISIAIVDGFKNEIRRNVAGFNSQVTVYAQDVSPDKIESITLTPSLTAAIREAAPESKLSTAVELQGILKTDSAFQGLVIKGVSPGATLDFIEDNLTRGRIPQSGEENMLLVSQPTASMLGLDTCSKVFAHFFAEGDLKTRRFVVAGIYNTHFSDYDKHFAFTDLRSAQRIARLDSTQFTTIELTGLPENEIQSVTDDLSARLLSDAMKAGAPDMPGVDNVLRSGASYYSWLDLLDTNVVVILVLMSLVAAFTLISSLFILILERVRMIGTLKSLGASNRQIRGIFIYLAEKLMLRGLLIGNAIGLGLIWIQHSTHLLPLDPDAYYLNHVPAEISWQAVLALNAGVIVVSVLVLILPSHLISTLAPSESMRYE